MRPKVLVVEDDHEIAQVLTLMLGMEGVEVINARNGFEGLRRCRAARPDLIITDLQMPELGGVEMVKILRSDPGCNQPPVLVFTAYAEELAAAALEAGASGVLSKTAGYDLLLQTVKELLPPGRPVQQVSRAS